MILFNFLIFLVALLATIIYVPRWICYNKVQDLKSQGFKEFDSEDCKNPNKLFSVFVGVLFSRLVPMHVMDQLVYKAYSCPKVPWYIKPWMHIFEQLVVRLYNDQCRRCVKEGRCFLGFNELGQPIGCGCDMPAKAFSPYESCSEGNWGPMVMSRSEYCRRKLEGEDLSTVLAYTQHFGMCRSRILWNKGKYLRAYGGRIKITIKKNLDNE